MSDTNVTSWRCLVCGYIHHGAQPPEECPLCGAPRMDFEAFAAPAPKPAVPPPSAAAPAVRRWRCIVCGYIHEGTEPPDECPLCGAGADEFEPLAEPVPAAAPATATAARSPERILVIGGGIAGISAVEAIREAAPEAEITILSREPGLPYCRLNITRYLAGEVGAAELPLHPASWYAEQGINLLAGTEAESLDPATLTVTLRDGLRLGCEKLILAAGAHAFLPPLPGIDLPGVSGLRTMEDAEAVLAACAPGARVVIIGGGILGLEAAGALARRRAAVTVLEGYGWLLPRQLNQRGGEVLADHVAILGVQLRPLAKTREIIGDRGSDGRVRGVVLESGETLPADLVIVATGIRANTHLARQAGLTVGQGIVVDDRLQTSHPGIWAAGDVAEHRGVVYGLWGAAQYQGRIAGINAAGGEAEFGGLPRATTLKVLGVGMFSIGKIEAEDASFVEIDEERDGNYYRLLLHDGRLAGAILIGDTRAASALKRVIDEGKDLSDYVIKKARASQVLAELGIAD